MLKFSIKDLWDGDGVVHDRFRLFQEQLVRQTAQERDQNLIKSSEKHPDAAS